MNGKCTNNTHFIILYYYQWWWGHHKLFLFQVNNFYPLFSCFSIFIGREK
jgi:hypothetical protein